MSPGRLVAGRARTVWVVLTLTVVAGCLGAGAYAAIVPHDRDRGIAGNEPVKGAPESGPGNQQQEASKGEERLLRVSFLEYPQASSGDPEPQFRFHVAPRLGPSVPVPPGPSGEKAPTRRFQCRLDDSSWRACSSPYRSPQLQPGEHLLSVRAFNRDERPGPAASYSWRQLRAAIPAVAPAAKPAPMPFSIESVEDVEGLLPGDPAQLLPITVVNPNSVAIEVTSLLVKIAAAPLDCPAQNFVVTPSTVSPATPLTVPAEGEIELPAGAIGPPAIAMLNLPENQDACRGAQVQLEFSGEARE